MTRESMCFAKHCLLPKDVRQPQHAPRPNHSSGQRSATVWERSDGLFYVMEVGVTPKRTVAIRDRSIYSNVKLVLMVVVVCGAAVVVRRGCRIGRLRNSRQERRRSRVQGNIDD